MNLHLRRISLLSVILLFAGGQSCMAQGFFGFPLGPQQDNLEPIEQLGRSLFNDTNLSIPAGQGCVTCHAPQTGFTSPNLFVNFLWGPHFGAIPNRFGARKPPSAAYAGDSGDLTYVGPDQFGVDWEGGMFWDGRASGHHAMFPESDSSPEFDPLAEQALAPFLNPVEQNVPNKATVVRKVAFSRYRQQFLNVWGPGSLNFQDKEVVEQAYDQIVKSIAAFERSSEVNPFSSKFDAWLAGEVELTEQEKLGLWLFENPFDGQSLLDPNEEEGRTPFPQGNQGKARCGICHSELPGPNDEPPLFTDFAYHNIGIPKNPNNPFYFMPPRFNPDGRNFVDRGLAATLENFLLQQSTPPEDAPLKVLNKEITQEDIDNAEGRHKTPTLRNVNLRPFSGFVKAYAHNGVFKSMEEIVHFYNARDVPGEFDEPEVPVNLTQGIVGDLGLTEEEELAIVAFMATLSDGYTPPSENDFPFPLPFPFPFPLP